MRRFARPLPARLALALVVLVSGLPAPACAPQQHDCVSSCEKLFGATNGQCDIQVPGHTGADGQSYMLNECENYCQQAMDKAGDVGTYNPLVRTSGNEKVGLDNDAQAALWMDCVDTTACSDLKDNYCAPTTNFGTSLGQ